jgi:hypothetical protein
MTDVLAAIRRTFADVPRPEQFTDDRHSPDRAEHKETLRSHTLDTISLEQVGNAGWAPICFVTVEGFKYFMPGLARLVLARGYIGRAAMVNNSGCHWSYPTTALGPRSTGSPVVKKASANFNSEVLWILLVVPDQCSWCDDRRHPVLA